MSTQTKKWVSVNEAYNQSGISPTQLRRLKAEGRFTAGIEYIYISGRKGGPVGWDPSAIENWQIQQSQLITEAPVKAAEEIETFSAMGG